MGKFVKQSLPKGAYKPDLLKSLAPYAKAAAQTIKEPVLVWHKSWCKYDPLIERPCTCGGIIDE